MGNEIGGVGPKSQDPPAVGKDETPEVSQQSSDTPAVTNDGGVEESKPPAADKPGDSRSGFLSSLNPGRLFGGGGGVNASSGASTQEPERKDSFLDGLMKSVRSGTEKLGQLNDFLSNPFVKDGLEVLRESGLNGMVLGAQVKKDMESGKLPADMVARLKSGAFKTGDVAFLLGYVRDLAGGKLELNLDSDAARRLISKVKFPAEVKPETIRGLQLGPGDKLIVRFSGDPLYDAGAVSFDFNKELELSISGIGDPNATNLTFEADGGTATEMMFSGWNLEVTNNKTIDGALSFLAKILLAPFLLVAGLFGDAKGTRVELEDKEDGSTRLRAEAMGATLTDEQLTGPKVDDTRRRRRRRAEAMGTTQTDELTGPKVDDEPTKKP